MKQNLILAGIVIVLGLAIAGGYYFPKFQAVGSPAGSTFNTAKFAGVVALLSTPGANGTSSSILNGDTSDRYITALKAGCQVLGTSKTAYSGAALAALTVSVATSSTSGPATNSNTNVVGTTAMTIGTSTPQFVSASSTASNGSTAPGSAYISNVWSAGSYLTFTTNATNTAMCTFGADYIGS